MHHTRVLFVFAFLSCVVLQLSCTGCGEAGPPNPPLTSQPPPSVDSVPDRVPAPIVSLALRGSTEPKLVAGWPWLLSARVLHPAALGEEGSTVWNLSGESAFSLELRDEAGVPVAAAFERLGTPLSGPISFDATRELELAWRLPAVEAAKLPVGRYTLRLALVSDGVNTHSVPVEFTLAETIDTSEHTLRLVAADDAIARGDLSSAEAEVDAVLAVDPKHVQALARKADLRERAGDLAAASAGFNDAINAALEAEPGAPEGGPRHLFFRRAQLDGGIY